MYACVDRFIQLHAVGVVMFMTTIPMKTLITIFALHVCLAFAESLHRFSLSSHI